jgi:hypothetical protein
MILDRKITFNVKNHSIMKIGSIASSIKRNFTFHVHCRQLFANSPLVMPTIWTLTRRHDIFELNESYQYNSAIGMGVLRFYLVLALG